MGGKGKKFRGSASATLSGSQFTAPMASLKNPHSSQQGKASRQQQYPQLSQNILHTKKQHSKSVLPLHLKQPLKCPTHTIKRSRMSAPNSKAGLKPKLSGPTGLESIIELSAELGMTELSDISLSLGKYQGRDKWSERTRLLKPKAQLNRVTRLYRLLSNSVRHNTKVSVSRQKGLRNLTGALCYRHSLFQALIHSPVILNWLTMHVRGLDCIEPDQEQCVPCAMKAVALAYRAGTAQSLEDALRLASKLFSIHGWRVDTASGQGDPEEMLAFIRNMFSRQVSSGSFKAFEASNCLLLDRVIKCNRCSTESGNRGNVEGLLSIPLIKPRPADNKLESYIAKYMVEQVEDYRCEKCQDKSDKTRKAQIAHSPDLLIVQLKRFDGFGRKDSAPVRFGTTLDLDLYRSECNKHTSKYDLLAVVMHSGGTGGGHYICVARGEDGEWYDFNDSRVSKSSAAEATRSAGGFTPYLMFYQRRKD